ncbi:MAG: HAD hydrolase-like protein [Cloacibacterium sp.]|nr:HAD hydrolase-like protein [Cloacibacterium sp.]
MKVLIFDVDGTLADTEKLGHLSACNDAIRQLNLGFQWSWEEYVEMVRTLPGNINRFIKYLQEKNFPPNEIDELAQKFGPLKVKLYNEKYLPLLELRPGIEKIIQQAIEKNIRLCIVSSSHEDQIKSLVENLLTPYASKFERIFGKETGKKVGEDGVLYQICLKEMGVDAKDTLTIEDAHDGATAAMKVRIPTAVFYNDYTKGSDFSGAIIIDDSIEKYDLEDLMEAQKKAINKNFN